MLSLETIQIISDTLRGNVSRILFYFLKHCFKASGSEKFSMTARLDFKKGGGGRKSAKKCHVLFEWSLK